MHVPEDAMCIKHCNTIQKVVLKRACLKCYRHRFHSHWGLMKKRWELSAALTELLHRAKHQ